MLVSKVFFVCFCFQAGKFPKWNSSILLPEKLNIPRAKQRKRLGWGVGVSQFSLWTFI